MVTMAALAGRTRRMKFGMNVVSLAFRDPVLLAKQCATIDVLSDGRLLPAFGIGSPLGPEWEALGVDTKTRGRKADECLEIIRRLWREDQVDFNGVFYKLKAATILPKPVQGDLPMWIGGSTDAAIRRTARIGTGWQSGGDPPAEAGRVVAAIKLAAAEAGRSIDEDHYGAGFAFHFGKTDAPGVGRAMEAYAKDFPAATVARDQLEHAVPELSVHDNGRIYKFVNDAVQSAVTGAQTPKDALAAAQQQSDRVLRAYK